MKTSCLGRPAGLCKRSDRFDFAAGVDPSHAEEFVEGAGNSDTCCMVAESVSAAAVLGTACVLGTTNGAGVNSLKCKAEVSQGEFRWAFGPRT